MKKHIVFLLCLIVVLSLFSCNSNLNQDALPLNENTDSSNVVEDDNTNDNTTIQLYQDTLPLNENTDSSNVVEDDGTTDNTTIQLSEAEKAMEMYEAVLNNTVMIYDTNKDENVYLKDYQSMYVFGVPLCEIKDLGYVYMDINNDSVNELFIDHGEISVLWYHKGMICINSPTIYHDDLKQDGSFAWRTNAANFVYGESNLVIEETELKTEVIWRIVNDGEPNAEYYIDEKQVTKEEILKYFEDNPKTKVEFSPIEASWQNKISYAEAIELAREYWDHFDIEENGYIVDRGTNNRAPSSVYIFVIRRHVIDHYSTFDEIWIDKTTGEAIVPYAPDAKG